MEARLFHSLAQFAVQLPKLFHTLRLAIPLLTTINTLTSGSPMLMSKKSSLAIMTSEEKLDLLLSRIESILKLLALQTVSGKKTGAAATVLDRAGLDRKLIAEILGTSQSSVRGFVSLSKQGTKAKSKNKEVELANSGE